MLGYPLNKLADVFERGGDDFKKFLYTLKINPFLPQE
jgi:hypothetical protein